MNHTTGICFNCGADKGLHHYETNQCPKNGMEEIHPDRKQKWEDTVFEDSGVRKLEDGAPGLLEGCQMALDYFEKNELQSSIMYKAIKNAVERATIQK